MKRLRKRIISFFGFSEREVNGFIVLIFLMIMALVVPYIARHYRSRPYDDTTDKRSLDSLAALLDVRQTVRENPVSSRFASQKRYSSAPDQNSEVFDFDPNVIDAAGWQRLGVSSYIAERIVKYRSKGGTFKTKEDLLKIYGFPKETFERLYDYIRIGSSEIKNRNESVGFEAFKPTFVNTSSISAFDINIADTLQLQKVKGIGSVLAARIVKYRDRLGGFVSTKQLGEVFGLSPEALAELGKYASVSSKFQPKKININQADIHALKSHPYIKYTLAKVIVAFRQEHGAYKGPDDLLRIKSATEAELRKILPYIEF